jgi:protein-tyrosine phosphatase
VSRPTYDNLVLPRPRNGPPYRVVFVCTGNICRSPMAEVALRSMVEDLALTDATRLGPLVEVTSAGTGPWHEGEPMDPRAAAALQRAGFPPHAHVAHQVTRSSLGHMDLIVSLDRRHQQTLRGLGSDPDRLHLLRSFDRAAGAAADVPDPYYGDAAEFDACLAMIAAGCRGIATNLAARLDPTPSS